MMKTNTINTTGRMLLLYKHYLGLYGKQLLLGLAAVIGVIASFHAYMHFISYRNLNNLQSDIQYQQVTIAVFSLIGCLLYCGHAFPTLRSKEKAMGYLMLPASITEKFTFEFINRVLLFVLLFPLIYWISVNLVTGVYHLINPDYTQYKFTLASIIPKKTRGWQLLVYSLIMLIPTLAFTGSCFFKKLPLVKTILSVLLIIGFYVAYIFLAVDILDLDEYTPKNNRILFIYNQDGAIGAGIFASWLINITLLVISYYKIKESEA